MLTFYHSPGSSSMAVHVALHETGAPFEAHALSLQAKDTRTPAFLAVNPNGRVPTLVIDGRVLTENIAILTKIADRHPTLMAPGEHGRYRLLEMLAYISTEVHKSFKPLFTPGVSHDDKQKTREAISKRLQFLAPQVKGPYLFGEEMTVADAYLFVMLLWAEKSGLSIPESLKRLMASMRARPTVQVALQHEGLAAQAKA